MTALTQSVPGNTAWRRMCALTPEALVMVDTISRCGSFAAAARNLGKVPSALTYSVRRLECELDVLLFDRRSGQARLTAAGDELVHEGRRLLQQVDAACSRVRRVASGWEARLTLATDGTVCTGTMLDLLEAFDAQRLHGAPPTRMSLRRLRLSETWEALAAGDADLVIGILGDVTSQGGVDVRLLGEVKCAFVVAPHHPLARAVEPVSDDVRTRHRAVAADAPNHAAAPANRGLLPGQDVLAVSSIADQIEVLLRGLACGFVPESMVRAELAAGLLVRRNTEYKPRCVRLGYAWRHAHRMQVGLALQWWLDRLDDVGTRLALAEWRSRSNAAAHASAAQRPLAAERRPSADRRMIECAAPSLT